MLKLGKLLLAALIYSTAMTILLLAGVGLSSWVIKPLLAGYEMDQGTETLINLFCTFFCLAFVYGLVKLGDLDIWETLKRVFIYAGALVLWLGASLLMAIGITEIVDKLIWLETNNAIALIGVSTLSIYLLGYGCWKFRSFRYAGIYTVAIIVLMFGIGCGTYYLGTYLNNSIYHKTPLLWYLAYSVFFYLYGIWKFGIYRNNK